MSSSIRLSREVRLGIHGAEAPPSANTASNGFAGNPLMAGLVPFACVTVTVSGEVDAATGMLVNIKVIDAVVRDAAVPHLRQAAAKKPLSLASIARELFDLLADRLQGHIVEAVALAVSPYLKVQVQREELPMIRLSQRFEFSAAHRLHCSALSEAENWQVFGRCNNPNGHGHNYELEVTVSGLPDATSGTVMPIADLQKIVNERIIDVFDHKHLNLDCPEFRDPGGVNPTVENIARVLYTRLKGGFPQGVKLAAVKLWETPKTLCEYSE